MVGLFCGWIDYVSRLWGKAAGCTYAVSDNNNKRDGVIVRCLIDDFCVFLR